MAVGICTGMAVAAIIRLPAVVSHAFSGNLFVGFYALFVEIFWGFAFFLIPAVFFAAPPLCLGLIFYRFCYDRFVLCRSILFFWIPATPICLLAVKLILLYTKLPFNDLDLRPVMAGVAFGSVTACWFFRKGYPTAVHAGA